MKKNNLQQDLENLSSLGCAFVVKKSIIPADPESVIINSIKFFWDAQDVFHMLIGVLLYRIYDLVHVERLLSLARNLNDNEKLILKSICHLIAKTDKRYKLIDKKLLSQHNTLLKVPDAYDDPYLIEKWGLEQNFLKYGIKIPNCIIAPERKFFSKKHIITTNKWLKLRALFGPTYRADLAYLIAAKIVEKPTDALKILGCSRAVAYDLWAKLSAIDDLEKLVA